MSSLQTIIDNATFITIDRKKVTGQTVSRSGRLLTAELASAVPYKFTVGMHEGLKYSTNRALTEEIDRIDITEESDIDFGTTNTNLSYITSYQGDVPDAEIARCLLDSQTGSDGANIHINTNGTFFSSYSFMFKKGDYIQPGAGYRYVYTVTQDVPFAQVPDLNVPVHRTVIPQDSYSFTNKGFGVGSNVTFRVKMITKPTYSIVPHDRLLFNSDFELVENIRKEDS
jgi:hypothetical protein